MSDSPRLVHFAIRLVIFVLNLPDGQVLFWGEIQITEGLKSILLIKKGYGLVEMTYRLPEWQTIKLTFLHHGFGPHHNRGTIIIFYTHLKLLDTFRGVSLQVSEVVHPTSNSSILN